MAVSAFRVFVTFGSTYCMVLYLVLNFRTITSASNPNRADLICPLFRGKGRRA
jgi:hypothetical protein